MGASVSSNFMDVASNAVSTQATTIISKSNQGTDQSQRIVIKKKGKGNVTVEGNVQYNRATLNTNVLLKTLVTQKAQQDISQKVAQTSKALVSGLNLGQFSDSNNTVHAVVNATIDISTNIDQSCTSLMNQDQEILINTEGSGDVKVANNSQVQIAGLFSKCVEDTIANTSSFQKIQQDLSQSSSAISKGISIWPIVILIGVVLLFIMAPIVAGEKTIVKTISNFLFPMILVTGIILIIVYFNVTKTKSDAYGFSTLIEHNLSACEGEQVGKVSYKYNTPHEAEEELMKNKDAVAVDWKVSNIEFQNLPDGRKIAVRVPLPEGRTETRFYKNLKQIPCKEIVDHKDKSTVLRKPRVFVVDDNMNLAQKKTESGREVMNFYGLSGDFKDVKFFNKDVKINIETGKWQTYNSENLIWKDEGNLYTYKQDNDTISLKGKGADSIYFFYIHTGEGYPDYKDAPEQKKNTVYALFNSENGAFINTLCNIGDETYDTTDRIKPGMVPRLNTDPNREGGEFTNWTIFKKKYRNPLYLQLGVLMSIGGIFGTIVVFSMNRSTKKKSKSKLEPKKKETKNK